MNIRFATGEGLDALTGFGEQRQYARLVEMLLSGQRALRHEFNRFSVAGELVDQRRAVIVLERALCGSGRQRIGALADQCARLRLRHALLGQNKRGFLNDEYDEPIMSLFHEKQSAEKVDQIP